MTASITAARFLALRKRLNMDQSEFAELALTSRSTISRIESGESQLKYNNIRAIERALGSPLSMLLGDRDIPTPPDWYIDFLNLNIADQRCIAEITKAAISALETRRSRL